VGIILAVLRHAMLMTYAGHSEPQNVHACMFVGLVLVLCTIWHSRGALSLSRV